MVEIPKPGQGHANAEEGWAAAQRRAEQGKTASPSFLTADQQSERTAQIISSYHESERLALERERTALEREKLKRGLHSQPQPAGPSSITLEFAMSTDTDNVNISYLVDPYLPEKCVVGFYGRGATGKSPFLASIAAYISGFASTLWVSVEEPADWIKVRHIKAGGADGTLLVVTAVATRKDAHGRVIGSSFNVYEHLETAIEKAKGETVGQHVPERPVKLVVLDTAVGLTTWTNGAGPNSDEGVKRLLAYLQGLAEAHGVTIAIIGHTNKGKHEHFADAVMGASAWTTSPRLSFAHAADRREEYSFVIRVAKTNLVTFGATYETVPVHTLFKRQDGPDTVLCKVVPGPIVWGDADSMDLWEEATTVLRNDEEGFNDTRTPTIVEKAIQVVVETLMTTDAAQLTREEVEQQLGRKVGRRELGKLDAFLQNHPTVQVERGANNRVFYKRRE